MICVSVLFRNAKYVHFSSAFALESTTPFRPQRNSKRKTVGSVEIDHLREGVDSCLVASCRSENIISWT